MREDDDRLGPLALRIMAGATIADLKAEADEVAKLYTTLTEPERKRLLLLLFGSSADCLI